MQRFHFLPISQLNDVEWARKNWSVFFTLVLVHGFVWLEACKPNISVIEALSASHVSSRNVIQFKSKWITLQRAEEEEKNAHTFMCGHLPFDDFLAFFPRLFSFVGFCSSFEISFDFSMQIDLDGVFFIYWNLLRIKNLSFLIDQLSDLIKSNKFVISSWINSAGAMQLILHTAFVTQQLRQSKLMAN